MSSTNNKKGFTMLEVLTVILIIGILSALGWASMSELIQTNKAKETAITMTSFAERAVAMSKMRKDTVSIIINGSLMQARLGASTTGTVLFEQTLANGYSVVTNNPPSACTANFAGNKVTAIAKIGLSGVSQTGCFVACANNYCGAAVKTAGKNSFTAHMKRKSGWEEL
ncbi:MAG: type II secretion system GspH family protein [Fibromonadales bacterium]|nr:type II secretion system GspH family protein [Fibromonadales bacterium]